MLQIAPEEIAPCSAPYPSPWRLPCRPFRSLPPAASRRPHPRQRLANAPKGRVWDAEAEACATIEDSRLDDPDRIEAARELAHFGRPADALELLAGHTDADDPAVLTLRGFATRKMGDWEAGVAFYEAALARDPDYWQARSYMGLGMLARGERAAAEGQLAAIRSSSGRGTWAEVSLADALRTGGVRDY